MTLLRNGYQKLRVFWMGSIRRQMVLAFGMVAMMLMLGYGTLLILHQRTFLNQQGVDRAVSLASAIASSSTPWVLANDLVGLQEVLRGFASSPDLRRAYVLSRQGEVLGSSRPDEIGRYVTDPVSRGLLEGPMRQSVLIDQPQLLDVAVPIVSGQRLVGWARVELTRESTNTNLRQVMMVGLGFASLAFIVTFITAFFLAGRLSRGLYHFMQIASEIGRGNRSVRAEVLHHDELGQLGRVLNQMLDDLAASETKLAQAAKVFESSTEGIMITDLENRIISINWAFEEITGYGEDDVLGRSPAILSSGRHDAEFFRKMWASIKKKGSWQGEIWNRRHNGEIYPEWLTISAVRDSNGNVTNYVGIFSDISERKMAEERMQHLAHHDVLTDLPNRVLMLDRLEQALVHAQRRKHTVALLFLDIDHFKTINDTLGHDIGDLLLQEVAHRLLGCVREQDTVSRQGGDEFIVILPETDVSGAELVAQKMVDEISRPMVLQGRELKVTPSIGVSLYPADAKTIDGLIKQADVAMYAAKESGRGNFKMFCELSGS